MKNLKNLKGAKVLKTADLKKVYGGYPTYVCPEGCRPITHGIYILCECTPPE